MYRSLCSWESEWSGLFLIVSLLVFAILIMGLSIHYFLLGVRFLQWRARYWFWCRCPKMNKTFIYSYISVGTRVSVCVRESPCSLSLLFSPSIERTLPASNPCFMSHLTSLSPSPLHTELYLGSNSKSNRSPLFSSSIAHSTTNSSLIKSHTVELFNSFTKSLKNNSSDTKIQKRQENWLPPAYSPKFCPWELKREERRIYRTGPVFFYHDQTELI